MSNAIQPFKRSTDKVAIVGFHEATRENAPYGDESYEIWMLNEEYYQPWAKRLTRHFQLHPRWDYSRTNNLNDPNHFLWLKNIKGRCIHCKGSGKVGEIPCPFCDNGIYTPAGRENVPIYLQEAADDIPNSYTLPLAEITKKFLPGNKHYYTSSIAYMIGFAMLLGFKRIELYGFDMGSDTEYHYQRANFEYWIGLAHGLGFEVVLPGSTILTGKLYGYENMHTGFRQQLEMRKVNLTNQKNKAMATVMKLEAQCEMLKELERDEKLEALYKETKIKLQKKQALLNFVSGTLTEVENMTGLFENYLRPPVLEEEIDHPAYEENNTHVGLQYQ